MTKCQTVDSVNNQPIQINDQIDQPDGIEMTEFWFRSMCLFSIKFRQFFVCLDILRCLLDTRYLQNHFKYSKFRDPT